MVVNAGSGAYHQKLVVFLDRFDDWIFHTAPGERHFGWMFPD